MSTVPLRKPRAARARREICETGDPPGLVAGLGTATVAGDDPAEKAESIGEALVIEAQASLLQEAVRKARLRGEASNAAAEATLRSRRRIGKMLQVLPKNPGGWRQRKSCGYALQPQDLPPTLEEHGLQKHVAHRCEKLASVDDLDFDRYIEQAKAFEEDITMAGALDWARSPKKSKPKDEAAG